MYTPGSTEVENVTVCGQEVPFGTSLLFRCRQMPSFVLGVEICEDLWSALPPSTFHTLAGATVIANLSASDETVGKAEYRRALVSNQSARLLCGYLYASAGHGESTQDMVFAGHDLIAENGTLLAETSPFEGGRAETELDCQRMESERARNTSFEPSAEGYLTVDFDLALTETKLSRWVDPTPFIPHDERRRAERCELILKMQADGLAKRLEHAHARTAVIGISGGLDSCLALLVAVRAMKQLGRPTSDVLAVTMPCFGTTHRTRSNAEILCDELAVSFTEIDIANTVHSHFRDIGQDESVLDVTFENGQARVRTLELMDTANRTGGLVVGTGDLSELALGWATYNGDHMSMYGVNAGVPKTLVRHLVQYEADIAASAELRRVLLDILDTPVSPELLPARDGEISQKTEDLVPFLFEQGKNPFFVMLDGITDVRNFGAIARTCECAAVDAVIIPARGSVSVNADAMKTSAGALHTLPVCREQNLRATLQYLKDSGFRIVAATEKGDYDYTKADYTGPMCIIMGAEDTGVSYDHLALCDEWVKIPMLGTIESLNVSVAAGILIYEAVKQRNND